MLPIVKPEGIAGLIFKAWRVQAWIVGIMRTLQTIRWWVYLPLALIIIVPVWMWLGDFLGYDWFIAIDPATPRYSSEILGACYYIVWYGLCLVMLPGLILAIPFHILLGDLRAFGRPGS